MNTLYKIHIVNSAGETHIDVIGDWDSCYNIYYHTSKSQHFHCRISCLELRTGLYSDITKGKACKHKSVLDGEEYVVF